MRPDARPRGRRRAAGTPGRGRCRPWPSWGSSRPLGPLNARLTAGAREERFARRVRRWSRRHRPPGRPSPRCARTRDPLLDPRRPGGGDRAGGDGVGEQRRAIAGRWPRIALKTLWKTAIPGGVGVPIGTPAASAAAGVESTPARRAMNASASAWVISDPATPRSSRGRAIAGAAALRAAKTRPSRASSPAGSGSARRAVRIAADRWPARAVGAAAADPGRGAERGDRAEHGDDATPAGRPGDPAGGRAPRRTSAFGSCWADGLAGRSSAPDWSGGRDCMAGVLWRAASRSG